jgi:isopenicillin-N epimerase
VAAFLAARGADLVFVDNITTGVNSILRSFPLREGDEILVSDLVYGGVLRAALFAARERGATVRTVEMPYPFRADRLVEAYAAAVGPRTRLAIVEHITAQSALVFPLRETTARLRAQGVAVLADAAHAPGQIPVDIPSLGVDWYVGNLHKWAWTPRSSGILWAAPERQAGLRPAVISWGLDKGFKAEFDMLGTRDPSSHLSAPAAIALMREWGLEAIQAYNHGLAWTGAHRLAERWRTSFDVPEAMIRVDGNRPAAGGGRGHAGRGPGAAGRPVLRGWHRGADARLPGAGLGADFGPDLQRRQRLRPARRGRDEAARGGNRRRARSAPRDIG